MGKEMILFAFDRDLTVDSSPDPGPVPLSLVIELARYHEVWAIGNQALVEEAGIPGLAVLRQQLNMTPKQFSVVKRRDAELTKIERNIKSKINRLNLLTQLFPFMKTCICIDDYDISTPGWIYYTPHQFMETEYARRL
jgi:hypothetical protein